MLNVEKLQQVAGSSPTAQEVFKNMATYERNIKRINIARFKKDLTMAGVQIDRETYIKVLQELQAEGWGRILKGPRGGLIHFEFTKAPIFNVGRLALGETEKEPKPKAQVAKPEHVRKRVQPRPTPGKEWLVVCVPLQNGEMFKTHVPQGLTKEDAKRIGRALADLSR